MMVFNLTIPRVVFRSAVYNAALRPRTSLRLFRNLLSSTAISPASEGTIATEDQNQTEGPIASKKFITSERPGYPDGLVIADEIVKDAAVGDAFAQLESQAHRRPILTHTHEMESWAAPPREGDTGAQLESQALKHPKLTINHEMESWAAPPREGDAGAQLESQARKHPRAIRNHEMESWVAPQREPPRNLIPQQVQREPEQKEFFRFARILWLDLSVTLTDVVVGIARTAPVGRVLSVQFEKKIQVKDGKEMRTAVVLFDHEAAPPDLVRLAKQGSFRIRGERVVAVIYRGRAFHKNDEDKFSSRVLQLYGEASVEGFSEEGIRNVLTGSPMVMQALGVSSLGLESEPVETKDFHNGTRLIEWRFFDNMKQVKILLPILRRHYYKQLVITPGRDPCWDSRLYPRERSSFKSAFYIGSISKPYNSQSLPSLYKPRERTTPPRERTILPRERTTPPRERISPPRERTTSPSSGISVSEAHLLHLIKLSQAARAAAASEGDAFAQTFGAGGGVDEEFAAERKTSESLEKKRRERIAAWTRNHMYERKSVSKKKG